MIGRKMLCMVMMTVIGTLAAASLACSSGSEAVRLATEGQYHPFNFINDDGLLQSEIAAILVAALCLPAWVALLAVNWWQSRTQSSVPS